MSWIDTTYGICMLYFQLQQSLAVAGMLVAAVKLCFATAALLAKAADTTKRTTSAGLQITDDLSLFEPEKCSAVSYS
jgi:hypothetical protein